MTARLAPPLKDAHRIVPHLLNCAPRSALERSHARAGKPRWYYCGACILIGMAAVLVPVLMTMGSER